MKMLPKSLYVKRDSDGKSEYFVPYENPGEAVEFGEKVRLGIYKLVATTTAEGCVQTSKTKHVK